MKEALLEKLNTEKELLEAELAKANEFEKTHVFGLMDQYNHVLQRIAEVDEYEDPKEEKTPAKKAAPKKGGK